MPADARSESRVSNYTKFWQKDSAKDGEADKANRLDQYTDLVNGTCPAPHLSPHWRARQTTDAHQATMTVLRSFTSTAGVSFRARLS